MPAHLIAEEGPYRGLVLNLKEGTEWVIGRDPDSADFVVEDSTVSRRHVRLIRTEEGVYLKNLSRVNPTLVNDEERSDRVLLKEGDRITVGNTVFLFSEEEIPTIGAPEAPKAKRGGYDDVFGDLEAPVEPEVRAEETEAPPERVHYEEPEKPRVTAYDTIFEDSSEEEGLPFNLLSETPLILKVISGPNAGAEIGIEKGRSYTIGKDAGSSDIVFQDLSVSRNHARLTVTPEGVIELEDLSSKNGTVVNGALIQGKVVVTPQDLIALGTTTFLIIDREAPQETIYSPIVPEYIPPSVEEEPLPEIREEEKASFDWKKEIIPTKYLVMAGSLAAVFLIAFVSFFSLFKAKGMEIAQKEPVSEIKEALAKYEDVQFSFNPGSGKLFLTGHVTSAVDQAEMRYRIDQIDFITATEDLVIIDEYVMKMGNDLLSMNAAWRGVSIQTPAPGKFMVSGYVQSAEQAAQLSEYLTVNFPYLDRLENRVVIEENLNIQLQSMLVSASLGAVTFQLANGEVVLSGRYSEKMDKEFHTLMKEMQKVPGVTGVRNFAISTSPLLAAIDVTEQFQVGGASQFEGRGYSVVLNGKIYALGDAVAGLRITGIEQNTILLEKDGLKYRIDYTQ